VALTYSDFSPAPNQGGRPDLYEVENRAMDPGHLVLDAMAELAPWAGEFADLLRAAAGPAQGQADVADAWWADRGASRTEVMSRWEFGSRTDFEAVLRLEFAADVADAWLAGHPDALGLSYGYVLFAVTRGR
jgi:hypothetical protein